MNDKNASAVKNFFDDYASKFYSIYLEEQKSFITRILDRTLRKSMFKRFQKVAEIIHDCNCKNIIDVDVGLVGMMYYLLNRKMYTLQVLMLLQI